MKKNVFYGLIAAEIAFCLLFYLVQSMSSEFFASIITFPLEEIGWGLRNLSLSGATGNILAILLYVTICLVPVLTYIKICRNRKLCKADLILLLLSALLFVVLYFMINPGLFYSAVPQGGKMILGGTFYSVLCSYIVLKSLKSSLNAVTDRLQKGLQILLYLLIFILVYEIFGGYIGNIPSEIQAIQAANSSTDMLPNSPMEGINSSLTMTYLFILLRCIVNIIPLVFDILIIYRTISLIDEMSVDRYSEESVSACQMIAKLCVMALQITVLSVMCFNILQMLFHSSLRQINTVVYVPILSIIFTAAALLMARYIREDQKLKQDNDLFI